MATYNGCTESPPKLAILNLTGFIDGVNASELRDYLYEKTREVVKITLYSGDYL